MRYLLGPPPDASVCSSPTWVPMPASFREAHLLLSPRGGSTPSNRRLSSDSFSSGGSPGFLERGGFLRGGSNSSVSSSRRPVSTASSVDESELSFPRSPHQGVAALQHALPADEAQHAADMLDGSAAVKEGRLLLRKSTGEFQAFQFILSPTHLAYFSGTSVAAAGIIELAQVTALRLRAATDYAIELVANGTLYLILAVTHVACEEWFAAILRYCKPHVREKLLPSTMDVLFPALGDRVTVPVTLLTRVRDVFAPLSERLAYEVSPVTESALCLRRGERVVWLDDDDYILSPAVIFKSHVIECRPLSHRVAMNTDAHVSAPDDVVGFLRKQGADPLVRAWKRRWFFVRGENLFYSKQPKADGDDLAGDALGFINLESAQSIELDPRHVAVFSIVTSSRVYRLEAASDEDANVWVACLGRVMHYYERQRMSHVTPWLHIEMRLDSAVQSTSSRKEGFMMKRGFYNTRYKSRYFILAGNELTYYDASEGRHLRGSIPLAGAVIATREQEGEDVFSIVTEARTYFLRAPSRAVLEEWIVAIRYEQQAHARG